MMEKRIVVATTNKAKIPEMLAILGGLPCEFLTLGDCECKLGIRPPEVVEGSAAEGATFLSNAIKKATEVCATVGLPTLSDDSGLAVDHLGGRPGVDSAYYLGDNTSYEVRMSHILSKMQGLEGPERAAQFVSVVSLALPDGRVFASRGEYPGLISQEVRGAHGFGYDPIFLIPELGKTFAELSKEEKNALSHRAQSLQKMRSILCKLFLS